MNPEDFESLKRGMTEAAEIVEDRKTTPPYNFKAALGYYDSPDQKEGEAPVNPSINLPCPYCQFPMSEMNIRTHGFMNVKHRRRSYFYRTHRTCDEAAEEGKRREVFDRMALASEAVNDE